MEKGGTMSLLEQQIKELQLRKNKADLYKLVLEEIQTNPKKEAFAEVWEDVMTEFSEFVVSRVEEIENGQQKKAPGKPAELTEEDRDILKALATRAKERVNTPVNSNSGAFASDDITVPKNQPPQRNNAEAAKMARRNDMLLFAKDHKHLDRKRVTVHTPQGDVGGIVVGAIAPNLIIKTDTGHEVPVPPENITVE
jgi:hypothetical protein